MHARQHAAVVLNWQSKSFRWVHLSHEVKEDLQHLGNERLHLLQAIRVKGINEATQRNHCINANLQQGNTQRQQSANKASMKVNEAAQCHYCINTTCNKARHKLSLKALLMLHMPPCININLDKARHKVVNWPGRHQ